MLVYYLSIRVISIENNDNTQLKYTTNLMYDANYNTQNVKYMFGP